MLLYGAILKHSKSKQTEQMADLSGANVWALVSVSKIG